MADTVDSLIEEYHTAAGDFIQGKPARYTALFSQRDDVSVANPFGPVAVGWANAKATMERAATNWRDGEIVGFENLVKCVTADLAFIVEVERVKARIGGSAEMTPVALRTTSVFRREDRTWKIMHRHADAINTPQAPESIISAQ